MPPRVSSFSVWSIPSFTAPRDRARLTTTRPNQSPASNPNRPRCSPPPCHSLTCKPVRRINETCRKKRSYFEDYKRKLKNSLTRFSVATMIQSTVDRTPNQESVLLPSPTTGRPLSLGCANILVVRDCIQKKVPSITRMIFGTLLTGF